MVKGGEEGNRASKFTVSIPPYYNNYSSFVWQIALATVTLSHFSTSAAAGRQEGHVCRLHFPAAFAPPLMRFVETPRARLLANYDLYEVQWQSFKQNLMHPTLSDCLDSYDAALIHKGQPSLPPLRCVAQFAVQMPKSGRGRSVEGRASVLGALLFDAKKTESCSSQHILNYQPMYIVYHSHWPERNYLARRVRYDLTD